MDTPLVSVIVPNYNYAESLDLCLRAIARPVLPEHRGARRRRLQHRRLRRGRRGPRGAGDQHRPQRRLRPQARNVGAAHTSGEILSSSTPTSRWPRTRWRRPSPSCRPSPTSARVCGIEDPEPLLHDTARGPVPRPAISLLVDQLRGRHHLALPGDAARSGASVFDEIGPFNPALRQTEEVDYGYRLSRRYRVRLTSAVRGRHDHDHELRGLLRKLFHRARLRIPLYARARKFAKGFETASRAWGSLAALAALPALALPVAVRPVRGCVVPLSCWSPRWPPTGACTRFVAPVRGPRFLLYFVGRALSGQRDDRARGRCGRAALGGLAALPGPYDASFPQELTARRMS